MKENKRKKSGISPPKNIFFLSVPDCHPLIPHGKARGGLVYNSSSHEAYPKEYRFLKGPSHSLIRQEKSENSVVIYEGSEAVTPYS
jgi:hypothetical protein